MSSIRNVTLFLLLTLLTAGGRSYAGPAGHEVPTVEVVGLSSSLIGTDMYHCIRAGLQAHPRVRVTEQQAQWQVKVAVTTRPFLAPGTRLAHLILLRRVNPGGSADSDKGLGENAFPVVQGYRIDNTVIRPIPRFGFGQVCHAIVNDLAFGYLRR